MHDPNLGSVLKKKKNSNFFLIEKLFCLFSFSLAFHYHLEKRACQKLVAWKRL